MPIASRTPEGLPHRCPVCGRTAILEPSYPGGDAVCPSCGGLLWRFRDQLGRAAGVAPERIRLADALRDADSLDVVELVMELEEECGVALDPAALEQVRTVADLLRLLAERGRSP